MAFMLTVRELIEQYVPRAYVKDALIQAMGDPVAATPVHLSTEQYDEVATDRYSAMEKTQESPAEVVHQPENDTYSAGSGNAI